MIVKTDGSFAALALTLLYDLSMLRTLQSISSLVSSQSTLPSHLRYIMMGTHDLRPYDMLMMWTQDLAAILTGPCLPVFHVDAASILAAGMESE